MRMLIRFVALMVLSFSLMLLHHASYAAGGDTALEQDAQLYAARYNVSLSEALYRLSLQPVIGDLQDSLATEQEEIFGGLWIQHTPQFRVIVQLTTGDANSIGPYISGGPLWGLVDAQLVKNTYRDLEVLQTQTQRKLERNKITTESGINTFENRAEIYILAGQMKAARKILSEIDSSDSVQIKVVEGLSIPTADIYAGLGLATCTSGFSVQDSFGVRGITTAAHCNNLQSFSGVNLPFAGERFGGRNDVQWHTAPGLSVRNWARDDYAQDSTHFIDTSQIHATEKSRSLMNGYANMVVYQVITVVT